MNPISLIERLLNNLTMYQVLIYGLSGLAVFSVLLASLGVIFFKPVDLILSFFVVVVACVAFNFAFAKITKAPVNHESSIITGLILFFIIEPASVLTNLYIIAFAALIGMGSKYLLAYRNQHLMNPAAVGSAALVLLGFGVSSWWVGSSPMFIPTLIVGTLIVWKIKRWDMVLSFVAAGLFVFVAEGVWIGQQADELIRTFFLSWPTIFLGMVMLTEPLSTPSSYRMQLVYGALVGVLANSAMLGNIVSLSPELALMVANVLFYPATMMQRLNLKLIRKDRLADGTLECVFEKPKGFSFTPGQYLEWTMPHPLADKRGVRRYFTIASSPTEDDIKLGLHIMDKGGSSFKEALKNLPEGGSMYATQLSGEFMMPKDTSKKLVFIAGGIGVTPFRSMLKYVLDTKEDRDIFMFFANRNRSNIVYQELLDETGDAAKFRYAHVISNPEGELPEGFEQGFVTEEMIEKYMPDWKERTFYLSGPPSMVGAYQTLLKKMGLPSNQVVTDYFPGLA